ncbi:rCG56276 [Rattus norvegicus]|uniref:RCG56276 n=1 Tax=Rattus norvegicus TaxID=10116 RepID=A6IBD4_RAT|nr:rCG56276 [Rattus norvegicus]
MWALCSPRRTSLRLGACCWPIMCWLPLVLLPSLRMRSLCQLRTLVWGQKRPFSSRFEASPLKSPEVPLKFRGI